MLTPHEIKLRQEIIDAHKRMIEYHKKEIAKLQTEVYSERCCFEDNRKRLPVIK